MILFHATFKSFSTGQTIIADTACAYHPTVVRELERYRPFQAPSRSLCVFAAESVVDATAFLNSQPCTAGAAMHVYEVVMPLSQRSPFRIIGEIETRIKGCRPVDTLIAEYWCPTRPWGFWEHFGPSYTVVREVLPASLIELAAFQFKYGADLQLSQAI